MNPHEEGIRAAAEKLMDECDILVSPDGDHRHGFDCDYLEELTEAIIEAYLVASIGKTAEGIVGMLEAERETKH